MKNINKAELVDAVATKTDLSKKEVTAVIETLLDKITEEMRKGNKVTITGFGIFKTSKRAARQGRKPQTGATIKLAATTVPKYSAGKGLKEAVK